MFSCFTSCRFCPPECVPEGGCRFLPQVPAGAVRLRKGRLDALTALELRGSEHAPSESDCLQSCSIVLNEPDCVQNRSMSSDPGPGACRTVACLAILARDLIACRVGPIACRTAKYTISVVAPWCLHVFLCITTCIAVEATDDFAGAFVEWKSFSW